tara:strand:- start:15275 stop:15832 length:558 start_codon:yes stop_codon:yes gene_type:complete
MPIRKINSRAIGANVIVAEDVAANAITTAEIQDGNVTPAKLALSTAFDFANDLKGSGGIVENYQTATLSGSTLNLDFDKGNNFYYTLASNVTGVSLSNVPAPDNTPNTGDGTSFYFTLKLHQPATGTPYSINWPNSGSHVFKWAGGTVNAPSVTSLNGAHDIFGFYTHDGGATIYAFTLGQDLKT